MLESNIDSVKNFALHAFFGEPSGTKEEKEAHNAPKKNAKKPKRRKGR